MEENGRKWKQHRFSGDPFWEIPKNSHLHSRLYRCTTVHSGAGLRAPLVAVAATPWRRWRATIYSLQRLLRHRLLLLFRPLQLHAHTICNLDREQKRHIKLLHIKLFPVARSPVLPVGYPDKKIYVPWVPRIVHNRRYA